MSFLNININDIPEDENSNNFEPLPEGWYDVTVDSAELKQTNAGTGQYIKLTLKTDAGRLVFTMALIQHPNITAQNIGLQKLKVLMKAQGLDAVQDTDQLIGARVSVKLVIEKQEGYEPKNEVKAWKNIGGAAPSINKPTTPPPITPAPAAMEMAEEDIPF